MPSVFLSHSWEDKFFTRKLAERLEEAEIRVWIDEAELKIGDSLIHKISDAIKQSDYVVAVLSHNSVSSGWVQKELAIAMTEEIGGRRITVLPVLIEKCEIPPFLKDKVCADFTDAQKFESSFSRLLKALGVSKKILLNTKTDTITVKAISPEVTITPLGLEHFEDITLTGSDIDKTYKPDPNKTLYNIYFKLSRRPPQEWIQIFDAERRFPRHTMWREAWVEGQDIVVHCTPAEIKEYHLEDIKEDLSNTNQKYRKYLQEQAIQEERKRIKAEKEKLEISDALEGLEFD